MKNLMQGEIEEAAKLGKDALLAAPGKNVAVVNVLPWLPPGEYSPAWRVRVTRTGEDEFKVEIVAYNRARKFNRGPKVTLWRAVSEINIGGKKFDMLNRTGVPDWQLPIPDLSQPGWESKSTELAVNDRREVYRFHMGCFGPQVGNVSLFVVADEGEVEDVSIRRGSMRDRLRILHLETGLIPERVRQDSHYDSGSFDEWLSHWL